VPFAISAPDPGPGIGYPGQMVEPDLNGAAASSTAKQVNLPTLTSPEENYRQSATPEEQYPRYGVKISQDTVPLMPIMKSTLPFGRLLG